LKYLRFYGANKISPAFGRRGLAALMVTWPARRRALAMAGSASGFGARSVTDCKNP
jgi:hypothetical protein